MKFLFFLYDLINMIKNRILISQLIHVYSSFRCRYFYISNFNRIPRKKGAPKQV